MTAARRIDMPRPGFWRTRLVRGGPAVAARIWRPCGCTVNGGDANAEHDWRDTCDRFPPLQAEIDGRPADVLRVWTCRDAIDAAEYAYMRADAEWVRRYAPHEPVAAPESRVDVGALPPPF